MHKLISAAGFIFLTIVLSGNSHARLSGTVGAEAWYACWESESGLDEMRVRLAYDIEPSFIYGYSAVAGYSSDTSLLTAIAVDYLTSEMEAAYEEHAGEEAAAYRELKARLGCRIPSLGYLATSTMTGEFEGKLSLTGGNGFFNTAQTDWRLSSDWFKLDTVLLFDPSGEKSPMLPGLGYRYFSYTKPQAIVTFYGRESDTGTMMGTGVTPTELISGRIQETDIEGHLLLMGVWDTTTLGMENDADWFFDFLFYVGSADISAEGYSSKGRLALGWEGSIGLKHTWRWSGNGNLTARIGARVLQHKLVYAEQTGADDGGVIYTGSYIEELFYGPFVGISGSF